MAGLLAGLIDEFLYFRRDGFFDAFGEWGRVAVVDH
jgi:hypothetical protein